MLPFLEGKSPMKVQVFELGLGIRELPVRLVAETVMCGGGLFHGVEIDDDSFSVDTAAYAINEGGVLADTWGSDEQEDLLTMAFCVSEATIAELDVLRRRGSALPAGAQLFRANGEAVANREELDDQGRMTADVRKVIAAHFLASCPCIKTAEQTLLRQFGQGEIHQAFGRLTAS